MAPWGSRPGMCAPSQRVPLHTHVMLAGTRGGNAQEEAEIG